jgi:hypothetical protein
MCAMMRGWLFSRVGAKAREAVPFVGDHCDRVAGNVLARLPEIKPGHTSESLGIGD